MSTTVWFALLPATAPSSLTRGDAASAAFLLCIVPHMPEYRMSRAARLLGVSEDTVRRWAEAGRLTTRDDASGHRVVDGVPLAEFAVQLATPDVPGAPSLSSARNHFPGLVTRVLRGDVMSQVEIQAGPHRVVSLISTEAVDVLGLEPGIEATAVVKATSVVIEGS
jgi:molybdopterin-binding protein